MNFPTFKARADAKPVSAVRTAEAAKSRDVGLAVNLSRTVTGRSGFTYLLGTEYPVFLYANTPISTPLLAQTSSQHSGPLPVVLDAVQLHVQGQTNLPEMRTVEFARQLYCTCRFESCRAHPFAKRLSRSRGARFI